MPDSQRWQPWWLEAENQSTVATELLQLGRFSSAVFHALMARELAVKALRLAPATYGDLRQATYGELKTYTYGQLGDGLDLRKGHTPAADAPWLRGYPVAAVSTRIAAVEAELGLVAGALYEACRYPDVWPGTAQTPHLRIQEHHAREIAAAVDVLLLACRVRFNSGTGGG